MRNSETLSREEWFFPPDGILDGSDFDIARRFVAAHYTDMAYWEENPRKEDPEAAARRALADAQMKDLLAEWESRLDDGDERLAETLRRMVTKEVQELNSGMRSTVAGQAHLFAERLRQVDHIYGVRIEGNPVPPHLDQ